MASLAGRFAPMGAVVRATSGASLAPAVLPVPEPSFGEVLLEVRASTVCDIQQHLAASAARRAGYAVVPGHEFVGAVVATGDGVDLPLGARLGVSSLAWACGRCERCRVGREDLCARAELTGLHRDGGFAELAVADARYCLPLPSRYDDARAAALLCAGLLGYRALRAAAPATVLGVLGAGPAALLMMQLARIQGLDVRVLGDINDEATRARARDAGVPWEPACHRAVADLDALVLFPDSGGTPAPLRAVRRGGVVVCAGRAPGADLAGEAARGERFVRSVGLATRALALELLALADANPLRVDVTTWPLAQANEAVRALRDGHTAGSLVLTPA